MKPSVLLEEKRDAIRAVISRYKVANPRVFGTVTLGKDREGDDFEILVDSQGAGLFHLCGLQGELCDLLGTQVYVITPGNIPQKYRDEVLAEAKPI